MKRIRLVGVLVTLVCMFILTGCGKTLDKTTTFYSLTMSPTDYYIRLEKDGDFNNNAGMDGTYTYDGYKVMFSEKAGGSSEGYIQGDYLLYISYEGNDTKVPDEDQFEGTFFDGTRVYINFHKDGTMKYEISQKEYTYNDYINGTYKRVSNGEEDIIKCEFKLTDDKVTYMTFGVVNGVLYEALSSNMEHFTDDQVANIKKMPIKGDIDGELDIVAVIVIVVIVLIMFSAFFVMLYKVNVNKNKKHK